MLNREVLKELLTRHKQAKTLLVDAPMFAIQKNGKTAYLLGTDHDYDLAHMPRHLLNIIIKAKHVYTENTRPSMQEIADFMQKFSVTDLSQRIIDILRLRDRELRVFNRLVDELALGEVDGVLELHPNLVFYNLSQYLAQLIEQENHTQEVEVLGMDMQLHDLFEPHVSAMEPYGLGVLEVLESEEIAGKLEAIKTIFIPLYELISSAEQRTLSKSEVKNLTEYKSKFRSLDDDKDDKTGYSADCYTQSCPRSYDLDQELSDGKIYMATRNMRMLRNILDGFARFADKEVVFSAGADHLIGSFGLLNLLTKQGFSIFKIGQGSELVPVTFSYQQYRKSYENIKRSILSPSI